MTEQELRDLIEEAYASGRRMTVTPGIRAAVVAALAELESLAALRAAGDALARAARESGLIHFALGVGAMSNGPDVATKDRADDQIAEARAIADRLNAALAAWAVARGTDAGPALAADESTVRSAVRAYILAEFLAGEDPAELKDDTPLVTGGILDFADVFGLGRWVEQAYRIAIGPASLMDFDSVARIAAMVMERLAAQSGEGEDHR